MRWVIESFSHTFRHATCNRDVRLARTGSAIEKN
jgi:hypothetical protein